MSAPRVAVVTDSISPSFFFPVWHAYYGAQFGTQALTVFTVAGESDKFQNFELGALHETPAAYDDNDRLEAITRKVAELLETHDYVVRVDTDEFIIADPAKHASLNDYLIQLERPFVSARGFDVFQHIDEPPLDLSRPILGEQRSYAFALTAMNKTCVTSVPLRWDRGFHMTDQRPALDDIYLFHMKRADVDLQGAWNEFMAARIQTDPFIKAYYETPIEAVRGFHESLSRREAVNGLDALDRAAYNAAFESAIRFDDGSGMWRHDHDIELVNVIIPQRFHGIL